MESLLPNPFKYTGFITILSISYYNSAVISYLIKYKYKDVTKIFLVTGILTVNNILYIIVKRLIISRLLKGFLM